MTDSGCDAADAPLSAGAQKRVNMPTTRRISGLEGKWKRVKRTADTSCTAPTPSPSAEAMMTWLSACGSFIDGIRVEARGGAGRCLVAARDLPGGTVILRLPAKCALSPASCAASPLGQRIKERHLLTTSVEDENATGDLSSAGARAEMEVEEEQELVTQRSVLYAVLMAAPEDDAHCGPFLAHLRAGTCGTPHTWSTEDRKRLPLEVSRDVESYEAHIIGQYKTLFPSLSQAFPESFPASICTEEAWRLAHSIYTSHAFPANPVAAKMQDPDSEKADGVLLPLLDCMNHDSEAANVEWLGLGLEEGCGARVTRPVVEGEELLYSYGCKGNAELTIGYGFAIWENPHEVVQLRFDLSKYLAPSHPSWPCAAARLEAMAELEGVELRGAGDIAIGITQDDLDEACSLADAGRKEPGANLALMPQKLTAAAVACSEAAEVSKSAAAAATNEAGSLAVITPAARKLLRDIMLKKGEVLMRRCRGSAMGPVAWSRYERAVRKSESVKVGSHDCAVSPEGCAVALRTAQLQVLVAALDLLQEEEEAEAKQVAAEQKREADVAAEQKNETVVTAEQTSEAEVAAELMKEADGTDSAGAQALSSTA